jgi:hypothetical protein
MKGAYPWRICTFGFTHGCIMKTSCLCLNFVLRMMLVSVNLPLSCDVVPVAFLNATANFIHDIFDSVCYSAFPHR